jgi:hypothetical protein
MMKRILPALSVLFFAACASAPPAARNSPPRYATPEEIARLQLEARANFQRERQQRGMLAEIGSGPEIRISESPRLVSARVASPKTARRGWSAAEARYALEVGKAPSDLTAGERAVARGY